MPAEYSLYTQTRLFSYLLRAILPLSCDKRMSEGGCVQIVVDDCRIVPHCVFEVGVR